VKKYVPKTKTIYDLTRDEEHFIALFYNVESCREELHSAVSDCLGWLNKHPKLRKAWDKFISTGGATGDQLRDEYLGVRKAKAQKLSKHLIRLVSDSSDRKPKRKLPRSIA
jgi:hypothetical protein